MPNLHDATMKEDEDQTWITEDLVRIAASDLHIQKKKKEPNTIKIGDYNFNVSTSELVAVVDEIGDKVKWPREIKPDPSKRS